MKIIMLLQGVLQTSSLYLLSGVVIISWILSSTHVIISAEFARHYHKSNAIKDGPNSNTWVANQS